MYSLMVADDEKIVIDAVKYIIDKNFNDINIIETARSGREAIEKAEFNKPEIVLMDIRMPGINGIDAIREIKKRNPNTLFIIISAYEQFQFAKEAVKLGVIEYLLKPLSKKNLISAIEKATDIVEKDRQKRKHELDNIEKFENLLPFLEHAFIYSILLGEDYSNGLEKYKKVLELNEEGGYIIVISLEDREFSYAEEKFYQFFRNIMKYKGKSLIGPLMINRIVLFIPTLVKDEYSQRLEAMEIGKYIYKKINEYNEKFKTLIGIGSYKKFENITFSYEEALKAMHIGKNKDVVHIKDVMNMDATSFEYPKDQEKKLMDKCLTGDSEEALFSFKKLYQWIISKDDNFEQGRNKIMEVMVMLHRSIFDSVLPETEIKKFDNFLGNMLALKDFPSLEIWCRERIIHICNIINNSQEKKINKVILIAKQFIEDNYSREITLEEVSKMACVSPHYFSRLFKEETKQNFIEYLTLMRIDKAKELMKKGRMSIKEICYEIGYSDPNYFSRLFKKVEKMTPTEYIKNL